MNRPRLILFDFGDTVFTGQHDFVRGNRVLLQRSTNPHHMAPEQVQLLADKLDSEINALKSATHLETTEHSFQRLLFGLLQIELDGTPDELEKLFWDAAFTFTPTPGIEKLLSLIGQLGVGKAILSNTTFSGAILESELEKHNLAGHFGFVISSSDYGFRKPARILFEVALARANCSAEQAWFVGDSFEADVLGAASAGLVPVWYNPSGGKPSSSVKHIEISDWQQLADALT